MIDARGWRGRHAGYVGIRRRDPDANVCRSDHGAYLSGCVAGSITVISVPVAGTQALRRPDTGGAGPGCAGRRADTARPRDRSGAATATVHRGPFGERARP